MSCYLIKSKMNGLVLDIKGESKEPGAKVITYTQQGSDNQLWYDDLSTGTIRSKLTGFCMDLDSDRLVVRPYAAESHTQKWERSGEFIRSRNNSQRVLDIFGEKKTTGAKVGAYEFHGKENQQWEYVMVASAPAPNAPSAPAPSQPIPSQPIPSPGSAGGSVHPTDPLRDMGKPSTPGPRREFWIVSEMNQKVVDIQAASMAADAKVIVWDNKGSPLVKNQMWYLDDEGFIRSCLNNYVFQNEDNEKLLRMTPYRKNPRSQWTVDGKKIVNKTGECLELTGRHKDENGAELYCGTYKGNSAQHWMLQYA